MQKRGKFLAQYFKKKHDLKHKIVLSAILPYKSYCINLEYLYIVAIFVI